MQPSRTQTEPVVERRRFNDPWKFLPIAFVCGTILILYVIYVAYHCIPLLQLDVSAQRRDDDMRWRGVWQLIVFHYFTVLLLICYVRSILTHPGEVPDDDPHWKFPQDGMAPPVDVGTLNLQETKRTGDRRWCKWCGKYKPDRCHHCRLCRVCILKMDHHCPWIYNCVGFFNYKYFFLLLVYSGLNCHLIMWSMAESVKRAIDQDVPFGEMFSLFFGETLAFFMGTLVTLFLGFHIWLASKAMTTIEFCEKSTKMPSAKKGHFDTSVYDLGVMGNIKAVLGPNMLLWFFPVSPPLGDGMNFVTDDTRLTKDLEAGKGIRRKTHQRAQRTQKSIRQGGYGDDWSSSVHSTPEAGHRAT
mmetsp:Transcript_76430/g.181806  ORF Transcript_76430/g.181806 Transcript_76430/m.181806 type:complete len:357 (+) Transcript_76430:133-1203(+)|eukprot:CAMPEP_0178406948 /NCGR_PEP_ID=MMETSP0689_2-20121128/19173_1 /TAXON_ID=160604 /ORGANISM="Amphidinium massartii, Strain CS-259" /LENGTH=356 /DNA_ID=CAMNT_0020028001 /DNA_START=73 /DNA_END=1143 /DNA_ORIENTATION=-